jgi:hypothetical protein
VTLTYTTRPANMIASRAAWCGEVIETHREEIASRIEAFL